MNAGDAVAIVVEHVTGAGKSMDPRKRAAVGNYAAKLIDNGATDNQLTAWATHYGQRLAAGARIRPSQAWEDVADEQAGAPSPTALAGVPANRERQRERRTRELEHLFKLSDRQNVILATMQELTKEGLGTGEIVERVLGGKEKEHGNA